MELEDKDIERIEDYLLGKLSRKDKEAIEQRIEKNPAFAEEVDFMRSLIMASREKGEEKFEELRKKTGREDEGENERYKERRKQPAGQPQPKRKHSDRRRTQIRILLIGVVALIVSAILLIVL